MGAMTFLGAFALTLFAGAATGIGGLITVLKGNPGDRFLAGALGLSAGVMLYVSFMEILPEGISQLEETWGKAGVWAAVGAFFLGVLIMAGIDRLVPEEVNPHEPEMIGTPSSKRLLHMGVMTALAIGIHNFPEGFATFLSGLEDATIAIPVAVAIGIHNIPEGIAVAAPIRQATGSRRKAFTWALISGLSEPAGALIGFLVLYPFITPATLGLCFAAIAGIMVFISLDELLPTAIATGKHHVAVYGVIAGMAVMALSLLLFL
ncbi:zinc transporter ZupT [Corynebacterium glucuronolyticum]|uniref:zinc transporter ZupT n=1 Tax=Corynebacterium glucuronolyticum TaxID=39791 RepID=UPI00223C24A5|nr:zinc transporter ZupT [Corynebacterium glucuronolyticum]